MEDNLLVELSKGGDQQAFAALYHRYFTLAASISYSVLRNSADAEEVASEAFTRIWKNIQSFRGECAFKTWLTTVCRNLSYNKYKYVKRRFALSLDNENDEASSLIQTMASDQPSPAANAEVAEIEASVDSGMKLIKHYHQDILRLKTEEKLSYYQIAERLQINVGTVKSRLSRARGALRINTYA